MRGAYPFLFAVVLAGQILLPTVAAQAPLPSDGFPIESRTFYLTNQEEEIHGAGRLLLQATVPTGNPTLPWIPALGPAGLSKAMESWFTARDNQQDRELVGSAMVRLYYSLQANGVADVTVRLLGHGTDDSIVQLGSSTQTVSVDTVLPKDIVYHVPVAGSVLRKGDVVVLQVEVSAASGVFNLQYGHEGSPSAIERLSSRVLDSDGDGLGDSIERDLGTDPFDPDTDGDGLSDGDEVLGDTDPLDKSDPGLLGGGTEDFLDSDHDGLPDSFEMELGTDPFEADTDGDGYSDGLEFHYGSDPLDPSSTPRDHDGDGLPDDAEADAGTDPFDPDTDGDGITDCDEDPDSDGLSNCEEAAQGTDPRDPDSDDDSQLDGQEVDSGRDPRTDPSNNSNLLWIEPTAAGGFLAASGGVIAFALARRYAL